MSNPNPGSGDYDPRSFPGNQDAPAKVPEAPKIQQAPAGPTTSAGTGALPPSRAGGGGPLPPSAPDAAAPNTIAVGKDGVLDAFTEDKDGNTVHLFTVNGPEASRAVHEDDAAKVLGKVANFDPATNTYRNVPEETVKALGEGRPAPADYWKRLYNASEAEAVMSANAQLYVDGKMDEAQLMSANHLPTLQAQLADRPDMAWFGRAGLIADMIHNPNHAPDDLTDMAEDVAHATKNLVSGLAPVLKGAAQGAAIEGVAIAPFAAMSGPMGPAVELAGIAQGAGLGAMKGFYDIGHGQAVTTMVQQGYDRATIKKFAPVAGIFNAILMRYGFELMSVIQKASFLDGLVSSKTAQKAMANWLVKTAGAGAAAWGAMGGAQQMVNEFLNYAASTVADRPDLLHDPKTVVQNIIDAAIKGMETGAVLGGAMGLLHEGFKMLTPEKQKSPEGRRVEASIKRGEDRPLSEVAANSLRPTTLEEASQQESLQSDRASDQSQSSKPSDSPEQKPGASQQPSPGSESLKQEGASTQSSSSSDGKSIAVQPPVVEPEVVGENERNVASPDSIAGTPPEPKPSPLEGERKYVPARALGPLPMENPEATSKEILQRRSEIKNEWMVRGNRLVDQILKEVPEKEREGMTWYKAGNVDTIQQKIADPRYAAIKDQLEAALHLSPRTLELYKEMDRAYAEAGATSMELGTIKNVREYFQNRLYDLGDDKMSSDYKRSMGQSTSHARQRVFENEFQAFEAGMKFKTTDAAKALSMYLHDMAEVNTNRVVANGMVDQGAAAWKTKTPDGWKALGLSKEVPIMMNGKPEILRYNLVAPEGVAQGVSSIFKPDFIGEIPGAKPIMRLQNAIKTGNTALSFFHHKAFFIQDLAINGVPSIFKNMGERMARPDFQEIENDASAHGLVSPIARSNIDIMRDLTAKDGPLSDVADTPGIKQLVGVSEKSSDFLFQKWQRYSKVQGWAEAVSRWQEGHPEATDAQLTAAKRDLARFTNAGWGGLNWEAMGFTKTALSVMRLAAFAPDWLVSAMQMTKQAAFEWGSDAAAGAEARRYFMRLGIGGMAATELLNKAITGHFTDENQKGHKMEIEIAPHVHVSLFPSAMGEVVKAASMVTEQGAEGAFRYLASKMAQVPRLATELAQNTSYSGKPIVPKSTTKHTVGPGEATGRVLLHAGAGLMGTPFALSGLIDYLRDPESTPVGLAAVTSGVGRYSKPPKAKGEEGHQFDKF